ncbi:MAG: FkbM family methyltransferase [Zoogloeaceae bacterium]|jgi:FkbM family methyltransferase|nr:FkbM family methyltransferase [Zoogloeaceae bacterium]
MKHKFAELVAAAANQTPCALEGDAVLIYGAGNKGWEVLRFLEARGYAVSGFLDTHAKPGQHLEGIPVRTLEDWLRDNASPASHSVVIAVHNYLADIVPLQQSLKDKGFRQALNIVEFYNVFPGALPDHYWLTGKNSYAAFGAALDRLDSLLADALSRQWLEAVARFRLSGDHALLLPPALNDQYCPRDLPEWTRPLRLIDCGAFDGDTLECLKRSGYDFECVAAFEPDMENFRKLAQAAGGYGNVVCLPCAVGAKTGPVYFSAEANMSSRVSASGGGGFAQCVALDEALPGFRPNLIKMDIEGAELDALRGARRMIEKHRPGLAVSLYHTPGHLWQIPLMLHDWNPDYRFYLRGHAQNTFDLVLYAFPR